MVLPDFVSFYLSLVDISINFDYQLSLRAKEVNNKTVDGLLPAKLEAAQPTITKFSPKYGLSRGGLLSEFPCSGK